MPMIGSVRNRLLQGLPSIPLRRSRSASTTSAKSFESDATTITIAKSGATIPDSSPGTWKETLSMSRLDVALQGVCQSQIMHVPRANAGGIDWDMASFGIKLLAEASTRANGANPNSIMVRNMYLDGLKYVHGGLPTDLSQFEMRSVEDPLRLIVGRQPLVLAQSTNPDVYSARPNSSSEKNYIRSTTSNLVCYLITVLMLAIPIITTFISRLLQYEKDHHVAQRAIQSTLQGTSQLAKSASNVSLTVGECIVRLSQSPVGAVFMMQFGGFIQSIAMGVNDGVETTMRSRQERVLLTQSQS